MEINYNIKDLFRAPRSALSLTKIVTFLRANIVGYLVYLIANYLALYLSGNAFVNIWQSHGVYPCAYIYELNWYSSIIFWVSASYWFLCIYGTMCAVSKITLQELKGDYFYSVQDAHRFIVKNWHAIVFTPSTIFAILVFYAMTTSFFAFLSKTPLIGSLFLAIPFVIYFFGAIFAVFTLYTFFVSILLTPTIVGTTEEDTMGTVFNVYMLSWRFPLQLIIYTIILLPLIYLSQLFLVVLIGFGLKIMDLIFSNSLLMGEKFSAVLGNTANIIIPKDLFDITFGSFLANFYDIFIPSSYQNLSGIEALSSSLIGIFLLIVVLGCFSYALSVFSSGYVFILNILKKKSGVDIASIKSKDELIALSSDGTSKDLNN